jgi:Flp pilus assembly protein CpaB
MPRLRIRRRPVLYWALTGALALVTALVVSSTVAAAHEARAGYGTTLAVIVAARDIAPGATIEAADIRIEPRPIAVLPSGSLTETPVGEVASAAILEGEPVVESRVTGHGMIPAGSIGIAVPLDPGTLSLAVGDRVEVLATFDPDTIDGNPTIVVAPLAIVVDVRDAAVTLSLPQSDGERVAFALSTAAVTVALLP